MEQLLKLVNKLGPARLGAIAVITIGVLFFFVYLTARLSSTELSLLYADLSPQDSASIVNELETMGVPYAIDQNTQQIMVDSKEVGRVRMVLAERGIPGGANIGYEIFDKDEGFGTTRFRQNVNKLRAMEGELARTVSTLKPVESARIHLVLPRRELFMREAQEATASVFVNVAKGRQLEDEQIMAVQHLVAAAVPQLKPSKVSIVDQLGNLLADGRDTDTPTATSQNLDKMRTGFEMRLTQAIEDMISRTVGFGKVRAHVTAEMNFDRVQTNAEIYDPEGQIARSTQVMEETESESEPGSETVSVGNNLPGLPGEGGAGGPERSSNRVEEITNYEISKTVKQHVREGGEVERLSVAVLIDGNYNKLEDGSFEYSPRSEEEMQQIEDLVKSAVGFDADRGDTLEVVNMRFASGELLVEEPTDPAVFMGLQREDLLKIAETFTLFFVALLVVLLVLRPMVATLIARAEEEDVEPEEFMLEADKAPALAKPSEGTLEEQMPDEMPEEEMVNLEAIEGKVKQSSLNKVTNIIEGHPSETVSVIRNWMFQES